MTVCPENSALVRARDVSSADKVMLPVFCAAVGVAPAGADCSKRRISRGIFSPVPSKISYKRAAAFPSLAEALREFLRFFAQSVTSPTELTTKRPGAKMPPITSAPKRTPFSPGKSSSAKKAPVPAPVAAIVSAAPKLIGVLRAVSPMEEMNRETRLPVNLGRK